jgi:rubrerythrin
MAEKLNRRDLLGAAGLGALALSMGKAGPAHAAEAAKGKMGLHPMTASNLRSAFGGESMANMRYRIWGTKAEADGFPNVARLFRAIAYAEEVHASNHFEKMRDESGDFLVASMAGFGLTSTSENLEGAIAGEVYEYTEMYPAFQQVAKQQGENGALESFGYALAAEKAHAGLYAFAKKAVDGGKDADIGPVHICAECGYTTVKGLPARCPVCNMSRDQFKTFA